MRERHGRVDEPLKPANAERVYTVTKADLPLHCPLPEMYLWNSHPKVYLPIEATGEAKCPYCSSTYKLVDDGRADERVDGRAADRPPMGLGAAE